MTTINRSTPKLVDAFAKKNSLTTLSDSRSIDSNETSHVPNVPHRIATISETPPSSHGPPPGWPASKTPTKKSETSVCSPCQFLLNCFSCKICYRDDTYNARHNSKKASNISMFKSANTFTSLNSNIKLLLLGLDNAGKTSLALHLSGESIEDVVPTIGFSNYELSIDRFLNLLDRTENSSSSLQNWRISLYDLGGGLRIRQIWHNYFALVHAIVFVIDAADLERLDEVKVALEAVLIDPLVSGKPILIYLNKQDRPQTMDEIDFCKVFRVPALAADNGCPLKMESISIRNIYFRSIFSSVNQGHHTHHEGDGHCLDPEIGKSFRWLLEHIIDKWTVLNVRVMKDTEEQIRREKRLMSERLQRVQARQKKNRSDAENETSKEGVIEKEPKSSNLLVPPLSPISERSSTLTNDDALSSTQNIHAPSAIINEQSHIHNDEQAIERGSPNDNAPPNDGEGHISKEKLNRIIRKSDSLWDEHGESQHTINTTAFSEIEKALIPPPSASSINRSSRNNKIHPSP